MKRVSTSRPSVDDAPKLTADDLRRARLRIGGKNVSRDDFTAAVQDRLGKQRVTIMLDASLLAYFKAKAGDRGYQTLINQALHRVMTGEQIEVALRKVIREELRRKVA